MIHEQKIAQLEARYASLKSVADKITDDMLAYRAENLKMREALKKLADGPGNKMASWKETWASRYATDQLNRQEHTAHLAKKIQLMEKVIAHCALVTHENEPMYSAFKELQEHEAKGV